MALLIINQSVILLNLFKIAEWYKAPSGFWGDYEITKSTT